MIVSQLKEIKSQLPTNVTLVAVSKTKPESAILEAYEAGQRIFGENKVQEMVTKWENLPKDISWHLIGHLQTNKVKYMAPFVSLVHGVDSLKLLKEINKEALKNNRIIDCLLQLKIAEETTKFGLSEAQVQELLHSDNFKELKNIRIKGLMGMASFTPNKNQIQQEFENLKNYFDALKTTPNLPKNVTIETLSMGMSSDYSIAINSGSNMIRVGSSIFGQRNYN